MSPPRDRDRGLTLREALEQLVDPDVRQNLRAIDEERDAYINRTIASHGPLPRVRIIGERRPWHPLMSEEYKALKRAKDDAEAAAQAQYFLRLSQCRVFAREGSPTAPRTEIPATALPSPSANNRHRLRVASYDESRMVFGPRDNLTIYYDVRVWPLGWSLPRLAEGVGRRPLGRPQNTGFDDTQAIDGMKCLRDAGAKSVTAAAEGVIDRGEIDVPGASYDAKVRRLVRKFRAQHGQ